MSIFKFNQESLTKTQKKLDRNSLTKEKHDVVKVKLVKEVEGFTVGKVYEAKPVGGEMMYVKDDDGEFCFLYESYFEVM